MKKTFIAPKAEVLAMGTESLMQSSAVSVKSTTISNPESQGFTPAAKQSAATMYSFDL